MKIRELGDMWLITTAIAAVLVTLLWYVSERARDALNIGMLALILWGTTVMVFVDHLMGYLAEGGPFIETSGSAILLSAVLPAAALLIWGAALLLGKRRNPLKEPTA